MARWCGESDGGISSLRRRTVRTGNRCLGLSAARFWRLGVGLCATPPPPPISAAEFGRFCRIGLPNCWVSESRQFVLPNHLVSGTLPPRFADMLGFMGSGSPELEVSLTLGHCIIPFLCTLVVQIGTMKCFYCPQKDVSFFWVTLARNGPGFQKYRYTN